MIPMYNTKLFCDVFQDAETFKSFYTSSQLNAHLKEESLTTLYYLLYAKYGNNPISNLDENQFKYKLFSIIFSYGPTWEKKLDIQEKLRSLTESDILTGSREISNHAYNPPGEPSTAQLTEILTIDDQATTSRKKSKMEGYALLWDLLADDVTTNFIKRFQICFKIMVAPENPLLYETEEK